MAIVRSVHDIVGFRVFFHCTKAVGSRSSIVAMLGRLAISSPSGLARLSGASRTSYSVVGTLSQLHTHTSLPLSKSSFPSSDTTTWSQSAVHSPAHLSVRAYAKRAKASSGPHGRGIPHKPNKETLLYKLKHLNPFTTMVNYSGPRIGPDLRMMSNAEWTESGYSRKQRTMARFHRVFPDVLLKPFSPKVNLVADYGAEGSGKTLGDDFLVYRGNFLKPSQTQQSPRIKFEAPENTRWTLMLVDPDAPTRAKPDSGQWCHWVVTNIPSDGDVSQGDHVVEYIGPAPPKNSGSHRYIYLLCQQEGQVEVSQRLGASSAEGRGQFCASDFIEKHDLIPQGYCFFHSEWDESVTDAYRALGLKEPIFESVEEEAARKRLEHLESHRLLLDGAKWRL